MSGTVTVTGASTGIGRATALHLAGRGFRVLAGVRREADGAALGPAVEPLLLDITDAGQVAAAMARLDGGGLAGLVNNAGVGVGGPIEMLELDDLRRQFEVNLVGQVAMTQAALSPTCGPRRGGSSTSAPSAAAWPCPTSAPTRRRRRPCAR